MYLIVSVFNALMEGEHIFFHLNDVVLLNGVYCVFALHGFFCSIEHHLLP